MMTHIVSIADFYRNNGRLAATLARKELYKQS